MKASAGIVLSVLFLSGCGGSSTDPRAPPRHDGGHHHNHFGPLVEERLPFYTRLPHDRFLRCESCGKIYWPGAHFARLKALVESVEGG